MQLKLSRLSMLHIGRLFHSLEPVMLKDLFAKVFILMKGTMSFLSEFSDQSPGL